LAQSRDLWIVRLYTGRPGAFPSVEEAESYPYTEQEAAIAQHARRRTIAGAPEQVRDRLLSLAQDYGADEIMVVTITHDFKARLRSYQLLAEAFGLPEPPSRSDTMPAKE
jgi:alkanesulfonate monooxygenase SsuD/methylene tetrahydromethanopterin reductase-like flavin-dependent oxidoreductase (luciferase family)